MRMSKRCHAISTSGALLVGVLLASTGEAQNRVKLPEVPWMQQGMIKQPEVEARQPEATVPPVIVGMPTVCDAKNGPFENMFKSGADCARSPIELCTMGRLSGDLNAQYDFFFTTMTVADPTQPNTFNFTGFSEITFPSGDRITSDDHGIIRLETTGFSTFQTFVVFNGGTGSFEGASNMITAIGQVDSATGQGRGIYTGTLCLPDTGNVCTQ